MEFQKITAHEPGLRASIYYDTKGDGKYKLDQFERKKFKNVIDGFDGFDSVTIYVGDKPVMGRVWR